MHLFAVYIYELCGVRIHNIHIHTCSGLYRAKQVQINNKEREPIVRGLLSFEFKMHDKI